MSINFCPAQEERVRREEHMVDDTFAHRFPGVDADHALLVQV
jgi:hypothetical protein